ncbi:MAG: hypothetical protein J6X86_07980 [Bacteroidales bacterium]|nr:hypothetical protein [Bacteroidales bacterium]
MKRRLIIAITLLSLVGCEAKECRCYLLERWGNVRVSKTYIDNNKSCDQLGYDTPHPVDSSFRYCTDYDAPEIDTMEVVWMFWGH